MNSSETFILRLGGLLRDMYGIDFGYPLGENKIVPPNDYIEQFKAIAALPPSAVTFYKNCDGVSLPDVQNGYFIHGAEVIALNSSEPLEIVDVRTQAAIPILVFGSTGGGGRFAMNLETGEVLLLSDGLVMNRVFEATGANVVCVASDWDEFMERLLDDVEAFVIDKPNHIFMA